MAEGLTGEIGKGVVFAADGHGSKVGRLIDDHSQGEGPGELLSNPGFGAAESAGPSHC